MERINWSKPGTKKSARADIWVGKIIETPEGIKAEVRKTFRFSREDDFNGRYYSQMLITVYQITELFPRVVFSMNAKTPLTMVDVLELADIVVEAEAKIQERVEIVSRDERRRAAGLIRSPSGDWYDIPNGPNAKAERELYRLACKEKNEAGMMYFEEGHTGWRLAEL